MDRGAWRATVHRAAKNWTRLSNFTFFLSFTLMLKLVVVLQEGGPLPGPETGLTLRNELSEETHVLTKQEILLGKGT